MDFLFVPNKPLPIFTSPSSSSSFLASPSVNLFKTQHPFLPAPFSLAPRTLPLTPSTPHPFPSTLQCNLNTQGRIPELRGLHPSVPIAPILMGSASDIAFCSKIADELRLYGFLPIMRIASAHKVPERLLEVIAQIEAMPNPTVYISVAGRSNALSGMLDGATNAPVIACPPYSQAYGGADVFSSIRMPAGVAPMLVLDPKGAALAAAKIVAQGSETMREAVKTSQKLARDALYKDDAELKTEGLKPFIQAAAVDASLLITDTTYFMRNIINRPGVELKRGKVRDQYVLPGKYIALITTDRQSAFDRVLATIPYKGRVLNLASKFWFEQTQHIIPNHFVASPHPNVTIAKKCKPFPVEFIVRGYITGSTSTSLWKNYEKGMRNYCGLEFPDGLIKNQKLAENVLTPTTKEDHGDQLISLPEIIQQGLMSQHHLDICAKAARELFAFGQQVAAEHGLILVDTKYEFGLDENGQVTLIDEIHTPDSSRYWMAVSYAQRMANGQEPENVDKEILRKWFAENCDPYKSKQLPPAPLELVVELSRKYIMMYEMITWEELDLFSGPAAELEKSIMPYV